MCLETVTTKPGAIFSLALDVRGVRHEPCYITVDDADDIEYGTTWELAALYTDGDYDVFVIDSLRDTIARSLIMFVDGQKGIDVGPALADIASWRIARSVKPHKYHKPPVRVSATLLTAMMKVHNLEVSGQKGSAEYKAALVVLDRIEEDHGVDRNEIW